MRPQVSLALRSPDGTVLPIAPLHVGDNFTVNLTFQNDQVRGDHALLDLHMGIQVELVVTEIVS